MRSSGSNSELLPTKTKKTEKEKQTWRNKAQGNVPRRQREDVFRRFSRVFAGVWLKNQKLRKIQL
jgi:hypothetical protein